MFSIINNLIGLAVLIATVMLTSWSWWISIPVGLVLMTVVTVVLGIAKNKLAGPKTV